MLDEALHPSVAMNNPFIDRGYQRRPNVPHPNGQVGANWREHWNGIEYPPMTLDTRGPKRFHEMQTFDGFLLIATTLTNHLPQRCRKRWEIQCIELATNDLSTCLCSETVAMEDRESPIMCLIEKGSQSKAGQAVDAIADHPRFPRRCASALFYVCASLISVTSTRYRRVWRRDGVEKDQATSPGCWVLPAQTSYAQPGQQAQCVSAHVARG